MAEKTSAVPRFYRCGACRRWLRGKKKPARCVCGSRDIYAPQHARQAMLQARDAHLSAPDLQ